MTPDELVSLSALELAARLRGRTLTATEVVEAHLGRLALREPIIHAWTVIDADRARERARALDRGPIAGPLHGLPVGVKDIIDTSGMPTEYGSPIYRDHRPQADADCVAAAEAAGAIVVGKTVTTEFATFKPAATVNPRNVAHTPGGSSSGSAAAVADRMVPLAFGTQTMGSVIRPAGYCGVVGYKPSFGTIERTGVKLIAPSLDTVGVFARTVPDAALFVGAISNRPELVDLPAAALPLRIGICRTFEWNEARTEVRTAIEAAADLLARAGAELSSVALPEHFVELRRANEAIYGYELAHSLSDERRTHPDRLSPRLRDEIDAGGRVDDDRYFGALTFVQECGTVLADLLQEIDVLLTPSATGEAPKGLESTGSPVMNRLWTLLGAPAINVPVATGPTGLPVGLQVVGRFGADAAALAAAGWIHARLEST
jgi:Asp-tRNA(Asn)/Glu-tRNA(Gln) amidotransferase A subunit family amidase